MAHLTPHEVDRHGFATAMIVRRKVNHITAAKLGHWKDASAMLKRYVHPGKLPQVAEAIFAEGAVHNGTLLQHPPGTRLEGVEKKKKSG
jgi:hypothetical protein